MTRINMLVAYMKEWFLTIYWHMQSRLKSDFEKDFEIASLKKQLLACHQVMEKKNIPIPRASVAYKQYFVLLSKFYDGWERISNKVTPRTVKKWHETAFKLYWKKKSKPVGRPGISQETIEFIKLLHSQNKLLSPEKIREMLLNANVPDTPSANTIRKYIEVDKKPPTEREIQSWKTFLKNHKEIWAMDFFVVPTLTFKLLYVLIVINHDTRKIEHFGITLNPNSIWLKNQFRQATPFDHKPKYIIHDNDPVFVSEDFQEFLKSSGIKSKKISYRSPWQNGIAERAVGIIRRELTDHIIPMNEKHLNRLMREYVQEYYNTHRTHQGIECRTPIPSVIYPETKISETKLIPKEILGGLYHTYNKVA